MMVLTAAILFLKRDLPRMVVAACPQRHVLTATARHGHPLLPCIPGFLCTLLVQEGRIGATSEIGYSACPFWLVWYIFETETSRRGLTWCVIACIAFEAVRALETAVLNT